MLTPTGRMAHQYADAAVWDMMRLTHPDTPYSLVAPIVISGHVGASTSVNNVTQVFTLNRAWRHVTEAPTGHVTSDDMNYYASMLGETTPELPSGNIPPFSLLATLWNTSRQLATLAYNHMLVGEGEGMFIPFHKQLHHIDTLIRERRQSEFEYEYLLHAPGALSVKEIQHGSR